MSAYKTTRAFFWRGWLLPTFICGGCGVDNETNAGGGGPPIPTIEEIAFAYEIITTFREDHPGMDRGLVKRVARELGVDYRLLVRTIDRYKRSGVRIDMLENKRRKTYKRQAVRPADPLTLAAHFERHPAEYEPFGGEHSN